MKAYELGRRSKWKDYIDLYFLLSNYFSISEISNCASKIFGELYSEKIEQKVLGSHDIDTVKPDEIFYIVGNNDIASRSLGALELYVVLKIPDFIIQRRVKLSNGYRHNVQNPAQTVQVCILAFIAIADYRLGRI